MQSTKTFAQRVIEFNSNLAIEEPLPEGVLALNPFIKDSPSRTLSEGFTDVFMMMRIAET